MSRPERFRELLAEAPLIAPSLLKCDYACLQVELEKLAQSEVAVLHLDVMDGHFVPNLSYGPMVIESLRSRTDLVFDTHLMISDPARYLDMFLKAGCDSITVHIEAVPDPSDVLRRIKAAGRCAGLTLNPGTPVERLEPYLELCDLVLVMSVEPGFGGQSFMPVALDKLRELRRRLPPHVWLSVDGGIGPATIGAAAAAGANHFVAGSAVFDEPDYAAAVRALRDRARSQEA